MSKNRTVLSTTSGILGAKSAVVVNEVTDQVADGVLSFGKNIGRSRLASLVGEKASDVKANAAARIAEAGTDEAKAARALKRQVARDKAAIAKGKAMLAARNIGEASKKLGEKFPVSIEITDGMRADAEYVKRQFAAIDASRGCPSDCEEMDSACAYEEEACDIATFPVVYACGCKGVGNAPIDKIAEALIDATTEMCDKCISEMAEEDCECDHCKEVFNSESDEELRSRIARMREEHDQASEEAGCALYDHEEFELRQ